MIASPAVDIKVMRNDQIKEFAKSTFREALALGCDLYLSTENSKELDALKFKSVFDEIYKESFDEDFNHKGIKYEHKFI